MAKVKITGAEALMRSLENENVKTLFGYPGGSIMPVFDALYDHKSTLNHILVRHEQAATHAAQGFARVSLDVGESKTVRVRLYTDQFGYYAHDGERSWNIAPGKYLLKVGASSEDIRLQTEITLTGNPVRKNIRDNYFSEIL